ncbi:MAG: VWA domain-containing protein [Cellvibrionaceae bacterium]
MIVFERSWPLVFLVLPLVVHFLVSAYRTPRAALRVSVFKLLVNLSGNQPGKGALILRRNFVQQLVLFVSWLSIIAALCQPVWLGEVRMISKPSRDFMMAVDLSGSMEAEEFSFDDTKAVDRLTGVKTVASEFIENRQGDRFGLIVFGDRPYLQVPFTQDHDLFKTLLFETRTRMAGPKTMLGDAVGLAVNHFSSSDISQKVLILLTDGNDSGSRVPPLDAAQVAADAGITIHAVAVGDLSASGEQEMDVATLQKMSAITGGVFFRATTGAQLQEVYRALERLEPQKVDSESYRPRQPLFYWPLGIALVLQLLFQLIRALRQQKMGES